MEKLLDVYLKENGTNRNRIVRATSLAPRTLQRAVEPWPDGRDREANEINPRVMFAVAEVLKKTPGRVYDELIEMEMKNDMTTDEVKLLLTGVLNASNADALVTVDDMGDDQQTVVAEIELLSGEDIRFAVNKGSEPITKFDVLTDLSYVMDDYDHEDDGEFFPSQPDEGVDRPLVDWEFVGVSREDSAYLSDLSNKIFKLRK